jgi:hypothetical protein
MVGKFQVYKMPLFLPGVGFKLPRLYGLRNTDSPRMETDNVIVLFVSNPPGLPHNSRIVNPVTPRTGTSQVMDYQLARAVLWRSSFSAVD